ncbi:hypothetical protein HMPREF1624_01332 [Sporothrix schenckii ATCC 58251]|uniref:Uncharacterized protein n=1 Tax=Sporothrix schenckii (strain ATCC 58251 / de Perez 2211183) TaxID=1391915 RepID=U7Q5B8_SPOS1|nr:hypothetical protein HMPREF1624_01332 [Sporothrix schenckii ATCC 58251]
MNSILQGTAHDSTLPRLRGATDGLPSDGPHSGAGIDIAEHSPVSLPPEPCTFPGCLALTWMTTPFCIQHLTRIRPKKQNGKSAPTTTGAGTTATTATTAAAKATPATIATPIHKSGDTSAHVSGNPSPRASQPAAAVASKAETPLPTSDAPRLPRNAVLSPELSTTYMRRKTAPGSGSRPASAARPSLLPGVGQHAATNGAPVTPASRANGESLAGSYFSSLHTASRQNGTADHLPNGRDESSIKEKDSSNANGGNTILTPSESPPELRALHHSKKRPRSDYENGAQRAQTNEAPTPKVPAEGDKGVGTNVTERPNEVNGETFPPTTQASNTQDAQASASASNIVGNSQPQTNAPAAQAPTIHNSKAGPGREADDAAAEPSTSKRLGLRLSLQRRIQERDKAQASNAANGTPQAAKAAMTFSLDAYIYSQGEDVAPLPPPPEVAKSRERLEAASAAAAAPLPTSYSSVSSSTSSSARKAPDFVYAHIDPRVHWTRARPKAWHDAKQKEIAARGGRKANFGKAVQRSAAARRRAVAAAAATAASTVSSETSESPTDEPPTSATNGDMNMNMNMNMNTNTGPDSAANSTTRGSTQKASTTQAPTGAAPPPQVPSVWTGELPTEVTSNKPWMALLGKLALDEEAGPVKPKPSGRSKGRQ